MPAINSLYEWINIGQGQHLDNVVDIKLTNLKKRIEGTTNFEDVKVEWNSSGLMNDLGTLFRTVPFFNISPGEINQAFGAMDSFIRDFYKGPELEAYLGPQDKIPENIEQTFLSSEMRRPFWNLLTSLNQNKMCVCKILERPIPGVSDLDLAFWSGAKVKGAFVTELNENYRVLFLRGKRKAIDDFIEVYKTSKEIISI